MTDERARQILDAAGNIEEIVNQEVGRRMGQNVNQLLDLLQPIARAVNDAQNKLTALSVGYSRGSLQKVKP